MIARALATTVAARLRQFPAVALIKRASAPKVERGLRIAQDDLRPDRTFLVYSGVERYPMGGGVEAIGLTALADVLAALRPG